MSSREVLRRRLRLFWWVILVWCGLFIAWDLFWMAHGRRYLEAFAAALVATVGAALVGVWGLRRTSRRAWWRVPPGPGNARTARLNREWLNRRP